MTARRDQIGQKVRQWVAYAEEDLRLARHALNLTTGCPYRLVAYHAQQCVEKYLKAYLVHRECDFPYTHNISLLLELCSELADWSKNLEDAERLTQYAITTRYPGEEHEVTADETRQAIEIAASVKQAVTAALQNEGANL